jgi:hypothetical protein
MSFTCLIEIDGSVWPSYQLSPKTFADEDIPGE